MAKKTKRLDFSGASDESRAVDNPFAALAGLRAELPPGDEPRVESLQPSSVAPRAVVLRRQRKGHGGKTVTRIEGLPTGSDLDQRIKSELGTGARWHDEALVVQGDQRDRLQELLERSGYRVTIGS